MAGMNFGLRLLRRGGVVIGLFQRSSVAAVFGDLIELRLHQHLFVVIGHFAGEIRVFVELFG